MSGNIADSSDHQPGISWTVSAICSDAEMGQGKRPFSVSVTIFNTSSDDTEAASTCNDIYDQHAPMLTWKCMIQELLIMSRYAAKT